MIRYIYVAGPVSKGDQHLNNRAAILAAEQLRKRGYWPFVPHLYFAWHMLCPVDYEGWMALCFAWVARSDALVRLEGESAGADREMEEARRLGIPCYRFEQFLGLGAAAGAAP